MIYLDNSATTQPCDAAVFAMHEMLETGWYNPSALYKEAVSAEKRMEAARAVIASHLGIAARELYFTAGGTEADSLAILGAAAHFRGPRRVLLFAGEHPAVLETAGDLRAMGHQVDFVPADDAGIIDLVRLEALLGPDVALLSCMHVGNETGAVQPVAAAGQLLRRANPEGLLHVDGVQGFLRCPADLRQMGIDLYTVSAHKLHGPKGTGALAVRKGVRLHPRMAGGGQESGMRSGTENTGGIAAFAAAAAWMAGQADLAGRLREMKLRLYGRLNADIDGLRVNGPPPASEASAPHILNVSFPGVGGEVMLHALEQEGVLVGTGAACSSKKRDMSAAFAAMRAPKWAADSAVRFSFGALNTAADADGAAEAVLRCYERYKAFRRR